MSDDNMYAIIILVLNIVLVTYTMVNKIYKSCATTEEKTDADRIEKALKYLTDRGIEANIIPKNIELN